MKKLLLVLSLLLMSCSGKDSDIHTVAFVGDSITAVSQEALDAGLHYTYHSHYRATPGKRSDEMIEPAKGLVGDNPGQLVINLGTNDLAQNKTPEEIWSNIQKVIDLFPGVKCVHVVTLTTTLMQPELAQKAAEFNYLAKQQKVKIIDWDEYIKNHLDQSLTYDTVHPTRLGADVITHYTKLSLDTCNE